MSGLARWLIRLVGALHVLIGGLEIFAAEEMVAAFGFVAEADEATSVVRNAGLYNLFVAFLLFWALRQPVDRGRPVILLCLGFVVVAGIFGAITLEKPLVLALQTLPAGLALWALWRGASRRD
jgi:putative membrane protein